MASAFPNGSVFAISTAIAAKKTITAVSNANPGSASAVAHGYSAGGILLLSMASTRLDQRVVRVAPSPATDAFGMEGIDTTDTVRYPSGFGVGAAQLVTGFVPMSQTTDVQSQGGEQQFNQWVYVEDGQQRQRKTFRNARSLQHTMDYDADLAWHQALLDASDAGTTRVLRVTLPNGGLIYRSVEVSFDGEPDFVANQNQQVVAIFSLMSPTATRYAS